MLRKTLIVGLSAGLALASVTALADHDRGRYGTYDRYDRHDRYDRYERAEYDDARVVGVVPYSTRIRVSEPIRECWEETRYQQSSGHYRDPAGGMILGGLIGGVLGNQVGRTPHRRRVATVAGAVAGGAIGRHIATDRQGYRGGHEYRGERCDVRYRDRWEERIDGYDVTYEYAGRRHTTRMPYDPGDRVRVRVDVAPVR